MARIVYALTSQGRGHSSRVTAMAEALEARGHELLFCAGGGAGQLLAESGRTVVSVPVLRHKMHNNRIRLWTSLASMGLVTARTHKVIPALVERFRAFDPQLLITDFESYSVRAARRMGLPLMCFNHQQVLTHTRYEVPPRYLADAALARLVVNMAAPNNAEHVLVSSFFYPPLRDPARSSLVAPILRRAIREIEPQTGEHVLVYHNDPTGLHGLLEAMAALPEQRFIAYNFEPPANAAAMPNIQFVAAEVEGFLRDLAAAKAVVCTAGFTLISEALYLGKPLLVMPNEGIFEQTLNALYLERDGLGEAIYHRVPEAADLRAFLGRLDRYTGRRPTQLRCGNDDAVACIEAVLERLGAR
ncbi:glycosyl transferase [Pseudenhygromyxa sp. WMMC2535]|uniref:glycosyltransferase family protein n=1 Tax=Pseudenhygromyxa sp. WMMC2535 TaxID=2712867 RepID=UPI001553DE91|nr:glycosyltransferase family protein [Pseudenhygromyxa sp. WMMC2535]NVB39771.1 glycosyl transferase [Pseudenhygromyxa sp. WMMC2535]